MVWMRSDVFVAPHHPFGKRPTNEREAVMPSRRAEVALMEDEKRRFLEEGWTLQVASIGPQGFPHLVAMWYVVIDGRIHFTTFAKSQKVLNLRRNPKITAMLES